MAKYYLVMKSAVIAIMAAAFFFAASVSGQGGGGDDNSKFCGCGPAPKAFSAHVRDVLGDVVKRTSDQPENPDSGDVIFTTTSNPAARLDAGAAVATGTCFKGSRTDCTKCLAKLRGILESCESFGCAGGEFPGDCHLQFTRLK